MSDKTKLAQKRPANFQVTNHQKVGIAAIVVFGLIWFIITNVLRMVDPLRVSAVFSETLGLVTVSLVLAQIISLLMRSQLCSLPELLVIWTQGALFWAFIEVISSIAAVLVDQDLLLLVIRIALASLATVFCWLFSEGLIAICQHIPPAYGEYELKR